MATTYIPIATTTLNASSTNITFSSIPATYTDLRLVLHAIPTANSIPRIQFNSDTGTNYSRTNISVLVPDTNAAATRSTSVSVMELIGNSTSTAVPASFIIDIPNYANTSYNKTVLIVASVDKNSATAGSTEMTSGLWRGTAAISTIALTCSSGSFNTNSSATLYGIKAA